MNKPLPDQNETPEAHAVEVIAVQTSSGKVSRLWVDRERFVWRLTCPRCGGRGELDEDQAHGRVSVDCDGCPYHETFDFATVVAAEARNLAAVLEGTVETLRHE